MNSDWRHRPSQSRAVECKMCPRQHAQVPEMRTIWCWSPESALAAAVSKVPTIRLRSERRAVKAKQVFDTVVRNAASAPETMQVTKAERSTRDSA